MLRLPALAFGVVVATLALIGTSSAVAHLHDPTLKGSAALSPPGGPTPPGPSGKIDADFHPADGHHAESSSLRIDLKDLAAGGAYTLWGDDPSTPLPDATLVQFATATADDDGHARVEFKTHDGDALPFGATLDALSGLAVEVHDGANAVVLAGAFPTPAGPPGPAPALSGKSDLVRSAGSAFPDSVGHVESKIEPADAKHAASSRLHMEIRGLASHASYALWADDPAVAGTTLTQFGVVATDDHGKAHVDYDTRHGDTLPFGATLGALGGQALEVRDASDVALLSGAFPIPAAPPQKAVPSHGHSDLVPPGGPVPPSPFGKIDAEIRPADGHHAAESKLKIEMHLLTAGKTYELWGDDPATADATLTQFGTVTANDHGDAKVEYDTHHGDALPFNASLTDLGGQAVEVRDGATVVLSGEFPVVAGPPRHDPAQHGRSDLTRSIGSPFARSVGHVDELVRPADDKHDASSRLRIEVRRLGANANYTIWADDPSTADPALVQFATIKTNRRGDAHVTFDTRRGDALPFGATLDDLADGAIEVRGALDVVVLSGAFPVLR
jgi:hypothetical protein